MKTILVTGGAGFVGSHACKALSRAGYLPVTFDNLERGHETAVKWGPLERGDLRNDEDLSRAFEAMPFPETGRACGGTSTRCDGAGSSRASSVASAHS
jgi:UDP-glucose 4-epimerase